MKNLITAFVRATKVKRYAHFRKYKVNDESGHSVTNPSPLNKVHYKQKDRSKAVSYILTFSSQFHKIKRLYKII
ncbi:hypothetical protein XELAEV_18038647mg [Xenopus laevis]|uniref:Uncharacterized protein n=1 Tax=Xenopus laevis TaxID=8355 RepID=A0A974H752_XENLA|nr:hypothetical protein XELAEV_18038647mg [Xenopus laevis]